MDVFGVVKLFGGLALFLYGMSILGNGLERVSGGRLERTLERLTGNLFSSVLLGMGVTAAIQSSSATTVIVVGLVNSGILRLHQAVGIIMGANIGTTITAHILRLSDIGSDNLILQLLKPTTLAPMAAAIGIFLFMTAKKSGAKTAGEILLGFAILFTGMFNMEAAVAPLRDAPAFADLFASLSNPLLGVLAGALVTAVIQSSSASVGILQALSSTGRISYAAAFPIIMGQNIGTCVTALLASIGTSKNAKRVAVVHLCFNILGTGAFLLLTYGVVNTIGLSFWDLPIDKGGIANFHTLFNVGATLLLLPFTKQMEKLACRIVKDEPNTVEQDDPSRELDPLFLSTPGLALEHSRHVVGKMGRLAQENVAACTKQLWEPDEADVIQITEREELLDRLEDKLRDYLLGLSRGEMTETESQNLSLLLHLIGEFERVGDYAINILEFAQGMHQHEASLSAHAQEEMKAISEAVYEIVEMAVGSFETGDADHATHIEPLEEVVDLMEETLKDRHIERLRQGRCSVDAAFPYVESLSCLERIADHCSNVGVYLIRFANPKEGLDQHAYLMTLHRGGVPHFDEHYARYKEKYYARIA